MLSTGLKLVVSHEPEDEIRLGAAGQIIGRTSQPTLSAKTFRVPAPGKRWPDHGQRPINGILKFEELGSFGHPTIDSTIRKLEESFQRLQSASDFESSSNGWRDFLVDWVMGVNQINVRGTRLSRSLWKSTEKAINADEGLKYIWEARNAAYHGLDATLFHKEEALVEHGGGTDANGQPIPHAIFQTPQAEPLTVSWSRERYPVPTKSFEVPLYSPGINDLATIGMIFLARLRTALAALENQARSAVE